MTARVHRENGRVTAVDFVNVPSWVVARDVPVATSRGEVSVTVAYGGAIYASLPAAQLGLAVTPEHLSDLITVGREIKWALNDAEQAVHPTDPRLNGIYGTIWFDDLGDTAGRCTSATSPSSLTARSTGPRADQAPAPGSRSWPPTAACPPAPCCGTNPSSAARSPEPSSRPSTSTEGRRHPPGHRNGLPDRRAHVLDRPSRPAGPRVRPALRFLDAADVATSDPPRWSVKKSARPSRGGLDLGSRGVTPR